MHIFLIAEGENVLCKLNHFSVSSTEAQCKIAEVLAEAGSQAVLPCKLGSLSPNPSTIVWTQINKG